MRKKDIDRPHYECSRCGHGWYARSDKRPPFCPKCRSKMWDQPKPRKFTCHACGHVWECRGDEPPQRCPVCRSVKWNAPRYRLQCLRCGYKWVPRNCSSPDDVKICPRCKSRKWNRIPNVSRCSNCGVFFIDNGAEKSSRCPRCRSKGEAVTFRCPFCNSEWTSRKDSWAVCPVCGTPRPESGGNDIVEMWKRDNRSLKYSTNEGTAVIYLWQDGKPVSAKYLSEVLEKTDRNMDQLVKVIGKQEYESVWEHIANWLYDERDAYLDNVEYLAKRLGLSNEDATVLAIHFTGMGPEAISMRLDIPYERVRESFDRIMAAYENGGIVVDDTIYTDDPVSKY